jgi:hypothetical protein
MTHAVRIYKPAKTAMQSGRAKTHQWVLEFEPGAKKSPEPLMGWSSSTDTEAQVRLRFATLEEALSYAERKGLAATVQEAHDPVVRPKSYADNFRPDRIRH